MCIPYNSCTLLHFSLAVCLYICAILHPRCRITFYTLLLPPRSPPTNQPTHPTEPSVPGNCPPPPARPDSLTAHPTPTCPSRTQPVPTPTHTPDPPLALEPCDDSRGRRRRPRGRVAAAWVSGGASGSQFVRAPSFLPPASTSCLLTHSSGSRIAHKADARRGCSTAPRMKDPCW
jgi:hypothetical protein